MTEVAQRADFTRLRYGMVWEDADVLLEGLAVRPGDICLSIASAGDNAFALLTKDPERVVAVDLSPAQLAAVELRKACFQTLAYEETLEVLGSRPSGRRPELYRRIRGQLPDGARNFWDAQGRFPAEGAAAVGRFEDYFRLFRRRVLPLVHGQGRVHRLVAGNPSRAERQLFYDEQWDNRRWRLLFGIFFSRFAMGRLGRDPEFFRYVEGQVSKRILARTRHALVELDPGANPYLHWILTGTHGDALPTYLRPENYERIKDNLNRLEIRLGSIEEAASDLGPGNVDRFNLSDIFEYMSPTATAHSMTALATAGRGGGRLAYWNMLAPRCRPDSLANQLRPLPEVALRLHALDKAFFYSAFVVEEVT